jgi:hypothetical protein
MLNGEHLLELAEAEINVPGRGAPRQVYLRRAISSAYYALFHNLSARVAASFVPTNHPKASAIFYRAVEHGKAYGRCKKLGLSPLPREERDFFAVEMFSSQLCDFANEFVRLQDLPHSADYDPEFRVSKTLAREAVDSARRAIERLRSADEQERLPFLSYLLLGLRR